MTDHRAAAPPPSHWERWTHVSHRYVLPVAAGTAVAFGGTLLLDYQPHVLALVPPLLIAVGAVALSTSFAFAVSRHRPSAVHGARAPGEGSRAGPVRAPATRSSPADPRAAERLGAPSPTAFAGGASWEGSLGSSSPGDRLWHEWLPTQADGLGIPIVGPVPETLYEERPARARDPFPYREEDLLFLDQLARAAEVDDAAGALGLRGADTWVGGSATAPGLSTSLVEVEALTAIPPYLRASPPLGTGGRPVGPAPPPVAARSDASTNCRTCLVTLSGSGWQPCPGCFQPICPDCVVDSLASYGATGCAGCVQGRPRTF